MLLNVIKRAWGKHYEIRIIFEHFRKRIMFRNNICLLSSIWRSSKQFNLKNFGRSLRLSVTLSYFNSKLKNVLTFLMVTVVTAPLDLKAVRLSLRELTTPKLCITSSAPKEPTTSWTIMSRIRRY